MTNYYEPKAGREAVLSTIVEIQEECRINTHQVLSSRTLTKKLEECALYLFSIQETSTPRAKLIRECLLQTWRKGAEFIDFSNIEIQVGDKK
jgi:hypothetical protein